MVVSCGCDGELDCRFDSEGRLIVDWDEVSAGARSWGRPTPDDVSVMSDGRRIDSADKLREVIAEFEWLQLEQDRPAGDDGRRS